MNLKPKKCVADIIDRQYTLLAWNQREQARTSWYFMWLMNWVRWATVPLTADAHNDDLFSERFKTMWGKSCTITSEKQNNQNDKTHSLFVDTSDLTHGTWSGSNEASVWIWQRVGRLMNTAASHQQEKLLFPTAGKKKTVNAQVSDTKSWTLNRTRV